MTTEKTCVSLMACGGLKTIGAMMAGYTPVGAVEIDPVPAEYYIKNVSDKMTVAPVQSVDFSQYIGIDLGMASPSCKQASQANSKGGETPQDIEVAQAICRFIDVVCPPKFFLENVEGYRNFASFALILSALSKWKYNVRFEVLNSADFGVPQTRRRLILRASRTGAVLPVAPTHTRAENLISSQDSLFDDVPDLLPWNGWYAAIEDLIPTLEESEFADWQLARMPDLYETMMVDRNNLSAREATCGTSLQPSMSVTATMMRRPINDPVAFLVGQQYESFDGVADRVPQIRTGREPAQSVRAGSRPVRAFLCGVQGENGDILRDGVPPSPTITSNHSAAKYRAFLVEGDAAGDRPPTLGGSAEPSFTIKTASGGRAHRAFLVEGKPANFQGDLAISDDWNRVPVVTASETRHPKRAWLDKGRIVKMDSRCLARFQTLPDWYVLPPKSKDATSLVGNGVPCRWVKILLTEGFEN